MPKHSDVKLYQEVKVVIERLHLHEYEQKEKENKHLQQKSKINEEIHSKENDLSLPILKIENVENKEYFNCVKNENIVVGPCIKSSYNDDVYQTGSIIKEWSPSEGNLKNETKESLKQSISSPIENKSLKSILTSNNNDFIIQDKLFIHKKIKKPLLGFVPSIIKTEPEIRTPKRRKLEECDVVNIEKDNAKNTSKISPTDLISEYARRFTIEFPPEPDSSSSEKIFVNEVVDKTGTKVILEEAPGNTVCLIESAVIEKTGSEGAPRNTLESNHSTLVRPEESVEPCPRRDSSDDSENPSSNIRTSTISSNNNYEKIKVKPLKALGINNQTDNQSFKSKDINKRLDFYQLSLITSSSTDPKILEACKIYPIVFSAETRQEISAVIKILFQASIGLTKDPMKNEQYMETYISKNKNCSKLLVEKFNRILNLDEIDLKHVILIIPIFYLHIFDAFKTLKPEENFDFRIIMKKMFEAQSFLCHHDKIIHQTYQTFQKAMTILYNWLKETFVKCDLRDSLRLKTVINTTDNSPDMFGQDSLKGTATELENLKSKTIVDSADRTQASLDVLNQDSVEGIPLENINLRSEAIIDGADSRPTQPSLDMTDQDSLESTPMESESCDQQFVENTDEDDITECEAVVVMPNYKLCWKCNLRLPMCFLCQDLLRCPCLLEKQAYDRGPKSMTFCRDHGIIGHNLTDWLDSWSEDEKDHEMPGDPTCWSKSCNKVAQLICVCKMRAYCSLACQAEDWYEEHSGSCRFESDPSSLNLDPPQPEDVDQET